MTFPSVYLKPIIWVLQGAGLFPYSWPHVDPSRPWNPKLSLPLILWCIVTKLIVLIDQTTFGVYIVLQFEKSGQNLGDLVYTAFIHVFEILAVIVNSHLPFCGRSLVRIFQILNSLSEDTSHVSIASGRQFLKDNSTTSKQLLSRVVWKIDWIKIVVFVLYPAAIILHLITIFVSRDTAPVIVIFNFTCDLFGIATAFSTFLLFRLVFSLLAEHLQEDTRNTVLFFSLRVDRVSASAQNKTSERTAMILLNRLEIIIRKVSSASY